MAVFSSTRNGDMERPPQAASSNHLSILASGAKLVGHLETESVVKIEGRLEGSVRAADQVLVTSGGVVEGDVGGREVVIGGQVKGNVQASERVEVLAGGLIEGDLTTPRVAVQEGGRVNGRVTMADPSSLERGDSVAEEPNIRSTPLLQSA